MEDITLVTGCTLANLWAAAAFMDIKPAAISQECTPFDDGASFVWTKGSRLSTHRNRQCIFIRGFRAKRTLIRAEPLPNECDNSIDGASRMIGHPTAPKVGGLPMWVDGERGMTIWFQYGDLLIGVLDYIAKSALI
jgi:hypothetical protein